ncbi:MAG: hypothetical protein AABZ02_07065, partial [Bacteroidota bacterium]
MNRLLSRIAGLISCLLALTVIVQAQDPLSATKTSISFGSISVLTSKKDSFYVKNRTQFGYQITAVAKRFPAYVVSYEGSGVIFPFDSLKVRVTFTPDSVGSYPDTLVLTHNATPTPIKVVLSGTASNLILIASPRTG